MGEKSSEKLLAGIEASKQRGLARLLNALAIRHVGRAWPRVLAEHFGSIEAIAAASVEELSEVLEIGPMIAESVFEFLHSPADGRQSTECGNWRLKMTGPRQSCKSRASWRARHWW